MAAGTLLANEARTATVAGDSITMVAGVSQRGVLLNLNLEKTPDNAEEISVTVQAYDFASQGWVDYAGFGSYVAENFGAEPAEGQLSLLLYPGASENNPSNGDATDLPVPQRWRVVVTHSGAGSWTYSIGYQTLQ